MELSTIKSNSSATHRVVVDVGTKKDKSDAAGFVVVGPNSPKYHEAVSRMIAHLQSEKEADEKNGPVSFEEYMETKGRQLEICKMLAVPCVVDIFGFTDGGKPVPYSPETVGTIFDACPDWAFRVRSEVQRLANFLRG